MLQTYNYLKEEVLRLVESLYQDQTVDPATIAEQNLEDVVQRLKDETFRIALVAPFSAGKSTLVNGLLGRELLSMDVRAETASITIVKYGERPQIVVHFRDGTMEEYPKTHNEVSTAEMKEYLRGITAVDRRRTNARSGESVEDLVREVVVHWNLGLCRNGVEIIDTPGLFSRYEVHGEITQRILPSVNAVLFLVEPDNVGQAHFQQVIEDRVREAKNSSLDDSGRHIFFIINKIDQHTSEDIQKAYSDLVEVLAPVLPNPQILKVSAYFAMKSRMFLNGDISLEELRRDEKIKFVDHEGYPVAGRGIEAQHVKQLFDMSGFAQLEEALSRYFENKHMYQVESVHETVAAIYRRELASAKDHIALLQIQKAETKQALVEKLREVDNQTEELVSKVRSTVTDVFSDGFTGRGDGGGFVTSLSEWVKQEGQSQAIEGFRRDTQKRWQNRVKGISEGNAEAELREFAKEVDDLIGIYKQELIKNAFATMQKRLVPVSRSLTNHLEYFEDEIQARFSSILAFGSEKTLQFFDPDQLVNEFEKELYGSFSRTISALYGNLSGRVNQSLQENTSYIRKPGFWNWLKSWFGLDEKERHVDLMGFREDVTDLAQQMIDDGENALKGEASEISRRIATFLMALVDEFRRLVTEKISGYHQYRKRLLKKMEENVQQREESIAETVAEYEQKVHHFEDKIALLQKSLATVKEVAVSGFH